MSSVAQERDYNILLSISRSEKEEREKCLQLIRERRVDGWVVSTSWVKDILIETLLKEGIPFVLIGRSTASSVTSVNNDNVQAAFQATEHLLQQRYRSIAFLSGPQNLTVSLDRLRGYRQAIFEAGLPIDEKRITEADFSEEGGFRALVRMRKAGIFFDAGVPCALPSMKHWRFRMNWASSDLTIRR